MAKEHNFWRMWLRQLALRNGSRKPSSRTKDKGRSTT